MPRMPSSTFIIIMASQLCRVSPLGLLYINKVEDQQRFTTLLRACDTAAEVGRVVVSIVKEVPGLTIDTAKTETFINILLGLATGVTSGVTVPNFRKAIENAWFSRKD